MTFIHLYFKIAIADLTPYQSVFRERGLPVNAEPNHYNDPNNYALAQEFVREINTERENQYRENLARLLKKYEQEEEEAIERETLANEIRQNRLIGEIFEFIKKYFIHF